MNTEIQNSKISSFTPTQEKLGLIVIKLMSKIQVWVFRKTGGRFMNTFFGIPIAILTTVGRKSGATRQTPVIYVREGRCIAIVPSKIGMSTPPAWQYNIEANPNVQIQLDTSVTDAVVREATPEEEVALWPRLIKVFPEYEKCLIRTKDVRRIPIYLLEPKEEPA